MIEARRYLPMVPTSSPLKAGDWVEVRSQEEILASLDEAGNFEGMPFMPEMLKHCGKRFRVYKRAHKTCDFTQGMEGRRLPNTVHLEDIRCTGEAHGGCQAECLLFWKDAWLRRVEDSPVAAAAPAVEPTPAAQRMLERLDAATTVTTSPATVYSCQATRIPHFTLPLRQRDLGQYTEAYSSGNFRLPEMVGPLAFRLYDALIQRSRGRAETLRRLYDAFQARRGGVPYPNRVGTIPVGAKTPVGDLLHLVPGDLVRVKPFEDILRTLNREGRNRGMLFAQEMVPYCGHVYRVRSRVTQIIDEKSHQMVRFKSDCIILDNVVCRARYNAGLAFCPRSTYAYWRETWLERA